MRTYLINYSESPVQMVCTVCRINGDKIDKAWSYNRNKTDGVDIEKFLSKSFKKAVKKEAKNG